MTRAAAILHFVAALGIGALGGGLFWSIGSPLPWVLGSMAACVIASIAGAPIAASSATRRPMAAVVGVVLGSGFSPDLFASARNWILPLALLPVFVATAGVLCVTYFRRVAKLDPATAYFAGMTGGTAEMVVVGAERGADERTIGLVHAARIFLVVFTLPFLIRPVAGSGGDAPVVPVPGDTASYGLLGWTIGCVIVGLGVGCALRLPAWHLVGPLAVSASVHMTGLADFRIPAWGLAAAQVGIGATIGCRFGGLTQRMLRRTLLLAAGSTVILLAVTIIWAIGIAAASDVDPVLLTLAYSPGGPAEMSMVALSLSLEPAFVIVCHLARIVLVLVGAPLSFRPPTSPAP